MTTHDRNLNRIADPARSADLLSDPLRGSDPVTERVMSTELGRRTAALTLDDPDLHAVTRALFGRDI